MILGDSLHVMASLAEREHLRGQVQCIYFDPPYGIKFNSNWQVSTISRDVKDGKREDVSREPEQVKAFRDTWKEGIHSYLTYLRDRLTVARELLTESGSIFVQIGDENIHRVRALMDEVFGPEAFVVSIVVKKKGSQISNTLDAVNDYVLWYGKKEKASGEIKARPLFVVKENEELLESFSMIELSPFEFVSIRELERKDGHNYLTNFEAFRREYPDAKLFGLNPLKSGGYRSNQSLDFIFQKRKFPIGDGQCWKHTVRAPNGQTPGMDRLAKANRLFPLTNDVRFIRYAPTPPISRISNWWDNLGGASSPVYVVQTNAELVKRCILMTTDPGDLVLDPTCGSGTTAYAAEQWGRRWITIDTSRVALALARTRIMSALYPYYYLADSIEGRAKEQEVTGKLQLNQSSQNDIRQGFIYVSAKWNTSGSIANNAEIDLIWDDSQARLEPLRKELNVALGESWEEWEIPREADDKWPSKVKDIHKAWWGQRIARQKKIDDSIAKNADIEFLYDRPYEDKSRVRVAGPFTVESLSPHRVVPADEEELLDVQNAAAGKRRRSKLVTPPTDFAAMVLENLRTAGVHQSEKKDAIKFTSLQGWPGEYIGAEGVFAEAQIQRRAGIFLGPEFGTVSRVDLVAAAREATEARFDVLIACAFNFDAHASELSKLGPLPILKAKMNPDLHMADELKNTGKGNLFVVFGEPDIDIKTEKDGQLRVQVKGVDVFDPNTGGIRSNDTEAIAAWFIDTDYDEQNFFVRHAYFLGAQDPYKSLKTALKAEIDEDAWATLYRDTSRPFPRPPSGRIAVKVINHFGDEVMKVFTV
jgi:adenine-specific DNA-methyltransferase